MTDRLDDLLDNSILPDGPTSIEQEGVDLNKSTDDGLDSLLDNFILPDAPLEKALSVEEISDAERDRNLEDMLRSIETDEKVVKPTKEILAKEAGIQPTPEDLIGKKPIETKKDETLFETISRGTGEITEGITSGRVPAEVVRKTAIGVAQIPAAVQGLFNLGSLELLDVLPDDFDRPEVRRAIERNLTSSVEDLAGIEQEINQLFTSLEVESAAKTPAEDAASDVISLMAGGLAGLKTVGTSILNASFKKGAEKAIKPSLARLAIAEGVGAAVGEAAVAGTATDIVPFVLGDEHTPEVIQKRLLAPLEIGVIGVVARPVLDLLGIAAPKGVELVKGVLTKNGKKISKETLDEVAVDTSIELNNLAIAFDAPGSMIDDIMGDVPVSSSLEGKKIFKELAIGVEETEKIVSKHAAVKYVDKFRKLIEIERARSRATGIDVGGLDLVEKSELSRIINQSGQGTILSRSLIGDGNVRTILRPNKETGYNLIEDAEILPLNTIYSDVRKAGIPEDELNGFLEAMDALDDFTNVEQKVLQIDELIKRETNLDPDVLLDGLAIAKTPERQQVVDNILDLEESIQGFRAETIKLNKVLTVEKEKISKIAAKKKVVNKLEETIKDNADKFSTDKLKKSKGKLREEKAKLKVLKTDAKGSIGKMKDIKTEKDLLLKERVKQKTNLRTEKRRLSKIEKQAKAKQVQLGITDNKNIKALVADREKLLTFKPRMTKEAANKIIERAASKPALQTALQEKNKLNEVLLQMLEDAGRITTKDGEAIRAVRKNYLPAWKETINVTSGNAKTVRKPGTLAGVKARSGSGLKNVDPFEAQVRNIINVSRSIEQARTNKGILDFLLKAPEDEFAFFFKEKKTDVINALRELDTNPSSKSITADQITSSFTSEGVREVGEKITFAINGKRLQLTVVDGDLAELLNVIQSPEQANIAYRILRDLANFSRNVITVFDPTFGIRSLQRESQDFSAWTKRGGFVAPILRGEKPDYIPLFSNIKSVFSKEIEPELFNLVSANYGFSSIWGKRLSGLTTEEVIAESVKLHKNPNKSSVVKGVSNALFGFAERVDLAPRMLSYKIAVKNGAKHDEAMRIAFETGVNFSQTGTNQTFHKFTRIIPFSTAFINSTDRLFRLGKYNPKKLIGSMTAVYATYKALDVHNQLYTDENGISFVDKLDDSVKRFTMPIYGPWSKDENDYVPFSLGWVLGRAAPAFDKLLNFSFDVVAKSIADNSEMVLNAGTPEAEEARINKITPRDITNAFSNYVTDLASFPNAIPIISQAFQLKVNKDWRGKPIVNPHLQQTRNDLKFLEYDESTSPALVSFAANLKRSTGISLSPKVTQYLFESMGAGLARTALEVGDTIFLLANPDHPERARIEGRDIPGLKMLTGDLSEVPRNGISTQYFRISAFVKGAVKGEKDHIEKTEHSDEFLADLDKYRDSNTDALHYAPLIDATNEKISLLFDEMKAISGTSFEGVSTKEREVFGDPKKRRAIDEKRIQIQELQRRVLQVISAEEGSEELYYRRHDIGYTEELLNIALNVGKVVRSQFYTAKDTVDARGKKTNMMVLDFGKLLKTPKFTDTELDALISGSTLTEEEKRGTIDDGGIEKKEEQEEKVVREDNIKEEE